MSEALLPHLREVEHVEEVHSTQHENDDAKLGRDVLDAFHDVGWLRAHTQEEQDEAEVDQVEADQQEVIHRVGQLLLAGKGFDEKEPTVLVERARDPDRHPETDEEVRGVDAQGCIHDFVFLQLVCLLVVWR